MPQSCRITVIIKHTYFIISHFFAFYKKKYSLFLTKSFFYISFLVRFFFIRLTYFEKYGIIVKNIMCYFVILKGRAVFNGTRYRKQMYRL